MLKYRFVFIWIFACAFVSLHAQSVSGTISGTQNFCDTANSGFLSVSGYTGNIVTWQYSDDNKSTWISNGNKVNTQSYNNLRQSTCYRVIVKNGSFPADTSSPACNLIYAPTKAGTILGGGNFCGSAPSGTLQLKNQVGNILYWLESIDGGTNWKTLNNTTTSLTYSAINKSTVFKTVVKSGPSCLIDTSAEVMFVINDLSKAGNIKSTATATICYSSNTNTIELTGNSGKIVKWISSTDNAATWIPIASTSVTYIVSNLNQTTLFAGLIQNANCLVDTSDAVRISVFPKNTISAGADTTIRMGKSITLQGTGTGNAFWSPASSGINNPYSFKPIISPKENTEYILKVMDSNGCFSSDTILVTVEVTTFEDKICNIFSPNGDGINDTWFIKELNFYPENEVTVYNIYGNVVFSKKNYTNDWYGTCNDKTLPDGTYFYEVKINVLNTLYKGSLDILSGK